MCFLNVADEHLITQTGKKSEPALVNVMGPGAKGRHMGPRAEQNKYPLHVNVACWLLLDFNLL